MSSPFVRILGFLFAMVLAVIPASAAVKGRFALVIGNSGYAHVEALPNPVRDAADVADTLSRLGFEVTLGIDVAHRRFERVLEEFVLRSAGAEDVVFYYGGHGFQLGKSNYLVPVDAELKDRQSIAAETIQLNQVIKALQKAQRRTIVLLDACRNNPLPEGLRDKAGAQGLAEIDTGGGDLFVVFATEPGKLALDGRDRNSPFAKALLTHMTRPGLGISEMMVDLRKDVYVSTHGVQLPWDQSSLRSQFYFAPAISLTERQPPRNPPAIPDDEIQSDQEFIITEDTGAGPSEPPAAAPAEEPAAPPAEPPAAPEQPGGSELEILTPVLEDPAAEEPQESPEPPKQTAADTPADEEEFAETQPEPADLDDYTVRRQICNDDFRKLCGKAKARNRWCAIAITPHVPDKDQTCGIANAPSEAKAARDAINLCRDGTAKFKDRLPGDLCKAVTVLKP